MIGAKSGEKQCNKCKQTLSLFNFYKNKSTKDKLETVCKSCFKERANEYYNDNKEKVLGRLAKDWLIYRDKYLKKTYGIDLETYTIMYDAQNGKCKICFTEKQLYGKNQDQLVVDHCHKSGKVRGLLCQQCNKALGLFYDNPDLLSKAKNYLEENHLQI